MESSDLRLGDDQGIRTKFEQLKSKDKRSLSVTCTKEAGLQNAGKSSNQEVYNNGEAIKNDFRPSKFLITHLQTILGLSDHPLVALLLSTPSIYPCPSCTSRRQYVSMYIFIGNARACTLVN